MSDDPNNTISAEAGGRSTAKGDVPEALRRRYYLDEQRGAGVGFYADARVRTPAFRDQGARLTAPRPDPNVIRDMTAIAQHRGWTAVVVRGEADFRREAWLAAMAVGIEARGYRPTARDRQELERRQAASDRQAARAATPNPPDPTPERREAGAAVRSNMRIVEAVVRSRIAEPSAQARILAAARDRLARWMEQGARVQAVAVSPVAQAEREVRRERQRAR